MASTGVSKSNPLVCRIFSAGLAPTRMKECAKEHTKTNNQSLYSVYCSAYIGIVKEYKKLLIHKDLVNFVLSCYIADSLNALSPCLREILEMP